MADKQVRVVMKIMDDSWKSELTPDMLGDTLFSTIAEEIGSDNLLKLSRIAGGRRHLYTYRKRTAPAFEKQKGLGGV